MKKLMKLKEMVEKENKKARSIGINPFEKKPIIIETVPIVPKELAEFVLEGRKLFRK